MVHTQIPYASFTNASTLANWDGGLWDVFGTDDLPGTIVTHQQLDSDGDNDFMTFSGAFYGDIAVGAISGVNQTLNYNWGFSACGSIADTSRSETLHVIATIGDDRYNSSISPCPIFYPLWQFRGRITVNSELNLRLTVSTLGPGQGFDNTTASIGNFTLQLSLGSAISTYVYPQTTETAGISESSSTQTVTDTSNSHNYFIPVLSGTLGTMGLLGVILLAWWILRRRKSARGDGAPLVGEEKDRVDPFFINGPGNSSNEGWTGGSLSESSSRNGGPGYRVMDGHGLEVVEKIRRGFPIAYPLPDSLDIERGEKSTLTPPLPPLNRTISISNPEPGSEATPPSPPIPETEPPVTSDPESSAPEPEPSPVSRGKNIDQPRAQSLPTTASSSITPILDIAVLEQRLGSISRLVIPSGDPNSTLPIATPTTASVLAQRVGSVSHLLQRIMASRMQVEASPISETHPPAYEQGAWSNN